MKKKIMMMGVALSAAIGIPLQSEAEQIRSGEYFVTQSWSQERRFERPYYVNIPQRADRSKLPVLIFLHGNGGNARGAMGGFMRKHRTIAGRYVLVFANGYRRSWNIVSEASKADDRDFIEQIVKKLSTYDNIQKNNFSIMGNSNGAALVNQLAIECKLSGIRNYISGVSPLNVYQHDGKNFKAKGPANNYQTIARPMTGKRIMNISGTDDRLIPYRGGPSPAIPAKRGKLAFVDAEESIFLWAKQMGYKGKKLSKPTGVDGKLAVFSYLGGNIVHYRVSDAGHGASGAISEKILIDFLEGGRDPKKPSGE